MRFTKLDLVTVELVSCEEVGKGLLGGAGPRLSGMMWKKCRESETQPGMATWETVDNLQATEDQRVTGRETLQLYKWV
jgi:hypothetical protein